MTQHPPWWCRPPLWALRWAVVMESLCRRAIVARTVQRGNRYICIVAWRTEVYQQTFRTIGECIDFVVMFCRLQNPDGEWEEEAV